MATTQGVDLGSLKQFIDKRKIEDVPWTVSEWLSDKQEEEAKAEEVIEARKAQRAADLEELRTTASSGFPGARATAAASSSRPHTTTARATTAASSLRFAATSTSWPSTVPQTPPIVKHGGERRKVFRVGKMLSNIRAASPRNQQLRQMLPGNGVNEAWEAAWARNLGLHQAREKTKKFHVSTGGGSIDALRPITAPAFALSEMEHQALMAQTHVHDGYNAHFFNSLRHEKHMTDQLKKGTCFTDVMFSSEANTAKPRAENHPLLFTIDSMQHEDVVPNAALESGIFSQRLDELRWGELRRGAWTQRPERRKLADTDADSGKRKQERPGGGVIEQPGRQLVAAVIAKSAATAGIKDIHGASDELQRLINLIDPDRFGVVSPEVFVPLFFWLGLTRRRSSALTTLELAFGPGDISVASIHKLSKYVEVQIRLIEGLRQLARRESLEQLCEFITDMARIRTWFQTMKRDTSGHVDLVEVQNLFARMEVTSDRQTLFRFLTHIVHSDSLPTEGVEGAETHAIVQRTLGIGDFASLLCRCACAWLVHRTLALISPLESAPKAAQCLRMPVGELDREAEMRWVALQRKIIISLLVNHRFWGRESRTVLMSLTQPQMTTLGNMLSPEQWLSLFQRVRAQGIASTLPVGEEATDPDWLHKVANAKGGSAPRKSTLPELHRERWAVQKQRF
jgi:hypothetical protein